MLRREIARTFEHRITLESLVRASSFVVSTKLVAQQDKFATKMSSCANEHSLRLFSDNFFICLFYRFFPEILNKLYIHRRFLDISARLDKLNIYK